MKEIKYFVTVESPVIISESGGISFVAYTKTFIPGSIIRGMLAWRFIKKNSLSEPHKDSRFKSLFLNDRVSYGNAYIATPDGNIETPDRKISFKENWPLPLSLHHKKDDENVLIDLLLESREDRSSDNIEQTKWVGGYGRIESISLFTQEVKKQLFFHHERKRGAGVPEEGKFFNYEAISPGQTFIGTIRFGDDNLLNEFKNSIINGINNDKLFFIGRSKNSQYGRVKIEFEQNENDIKLDFSDQPESEKEQPEKSFYNSDKIILTFISDAVLVNERGEYCTDKDSIEAYLKTIIDPNIKIDKAFLRIKEIENYVSVWKLRRPVDYALRAGSCLVISDGNTEELIKKLNKFKLGLGIRLSEGFGRFVLNWQRPKLKRGEKKDSQDNLQRETQPCQVNEMRNKNNNNSESKSVIEGIIRNKIKEITELAAIEKAENFDKKSLKNASKSALGRLERAIWEFKSKEKLVKDFLKNCTKSYIDKIESIKCPEINNLYDLISNLSIERELQNNNFRVIVENLSLMDNEFKEQLEMLYLKSLVYALRKIQKS